MNKQDISRQILSDIIVYMKYARFLPELNRRETWNEIVDRNKKMHLDKFPHLKDEIEEAYKYVYDKKILPSMRSAQFAGKPIELNASRLYNCSFTPISSIEAFSEIFFLLLSGCGVGLSVQQHHIKQLPEIIKPTRKRKFLIDDSLEGWATALKVLLAAYTKPRKELPIFDYRNIREKGSPLKTAGGKAPGYEGLKYCLDKIKGILDSKEQGSQLTSTECHDIACYIAEAVVSGGHRRSSLITLFSYGDEEMAKAKTGNWLEENPQRQMSNNSVVFLRHKVKKEDFMKLWEVVKASGSGEPGWMFSNDQEYGLNPSLRAGTKVLTENGIYNIEELQDKQCYVPTLENDKYYPAKCILSGRDKTLFKVTLGGGHEYYCTKEHKWPIMVKNNGVEKKETWQLLAGHRIPILYRNTLKYGTEGTTEDGKKDAKTAILIRQEVLPKKIWREGSEEYRRGFIGEIFSSSHASVINKYQEPVELSLSSLPETFMKEMAELLGFYGIKTRLRKREEGIYSNIEGYYELTVSKVNAWLFSLIFKLDEPRQEQLLLIATKYKDINVFSSQFYTVMAVEETNIKEDVWDMQVSSDSHTFTLAHGITGNCGEISLHGIKGTTGTGGQFCVGEDTFLITKNGGDTIKNLVNKEIEIWNGKQWSSVKPFLTRTNQDLYRVFLNDGSYLDCTNDHRWLIKTYSNYQKFKEFTTEELISLLSKKTNNYKFQLRTPIVKVQMDESGENNFYAYEYGVFIGDGHLDKKQCKVALFGEKRKLKLKGNRKEKIFICNNTPYEIHTFPFEMYELCNKLKKEEKLPNDLFMWNKESILNFLAGWLDTDGSIAGNGVRLYSGDYLKLKQAQLLFTKVGIKSSLNLMKQKGSSTNFGKRLKPIYYLQIPRPGDLPTQRLKPKTINKELHKGKYQFIKKIEKLYGKYSVYCVTEPLEHSCLFNNVLTLQCNLSEINVSDVVDQEDLNNRSKAAAFISTLQSSYTDFHFLRGEWKEMTDKEALIGVSMTGIASGNVLNLNIEEAAKVVTKENERVAKLLGINKAARCTTVKPSGTSSIVLGTSSGVHSWHSKYYIRRVRVNKIEPIYKYLSVMHPELIEDDKYNPTTTAIISVPIKAPEEAILRNESEIDLLERVKKLYKEWILPGHRKGHNTNNVSVTVSVKKDSWDIVGEWLWENRDSYAAVSVLPYDDHVYVQPPFEEISEQTYNKLIKKLEQVDLRFVVEEQDNTDLKGEAACAGGQCEVR